MLNYKVKFIQNAIIKHNNKYDYSLVNYIKSKIKVKIICPEHGEFEQTPSGHLNGDGCPNCGGVAKLTNNSFISKSIIIHKNKYDYSLIKYINNKFKVKIICPIHGEFEQRPDHHLFGKGCPNCSNRITTTEFINRAILNHGDKYDYSLVNYIDNRLKVKIICPIHGEFEQVAYSHIHGNGCKKCKASKGEKIIIDFLKRENILFTTQKKFSECRDINELPFDFYLPDYNTCIEFHGKQHYEFIKHFHKNKINFNKQLNRDKIKFEYCENSQIRLLVIKYNENIINYLNKFLIVK